MINEFPSNYLQTVEERLQTEEARRRWRCGLGVVAGDIGDGRFGLVVGSVSGLVTNRQLLVIEEADCSFME